MPQAYGIASNNPGDLTVGTIANGLIGSGYLYQGQSGIQTGHTYYYAEFPDPTTGWNALVSYIQRHIAAGANTLASLTSLFGGGAGTSYLNNVVAGTSRVGLTGLSANSPIDASQAQQLAYGISVAEGTSSIVPTTNTASNAGNTTGSAVGGLFNPTAPVSSPAQSGTQIDPGEVFTGIMDYPAAVITGIFGGNTSTTVTGAPANNAPIAQTGADTGAGINKTVSDATSSLTNWLTSNGIVLIAIVGAGLLAVVAISSAFSNSGQGSKTTIVPIPA